jgi:polysaccharide biosynthesis protein PslH
MLNDQNSLKEFFLLVPKKVDLRINQALITNLMNILFLTEISPFPPNGGEKLRSYGLLKLLSEPKMQVHAITGSSPDKTADSAGFNNVKFYTFDFDRIKSDKRITGYARLFYCNKELVDLINRILQQNRIDVAIIDYLFYGQYIRLFRTKGIPVIYGTHNAQARLIIQRPAQTFRTRITRFTDYLISRIHEYLYFRMADALIVVSENDKEYHAGFVNRNKITLIPNFLIESEYGSFAGKKENYVLMTANFNAHQNFYGLEWFVDKVWDKELWDRTQLILVGVGSDWAYSRLKETHDLKNIQAIGAVDDLKPFISKAMVSIVPLLHGSGSRLKCLESMALKTQLVSTAKGAEGIDHHNSIIIADTPGHFRAAILNIMNTKTDYTEIAYQAFLKSYSLMPNKKIISDLISKLLTGQA